MVAEPVTQVRLLDALCRRSALNDSYGRGPSGCPGWDSVPAISLRSTNEIFAPTDSTGARASDFGRENKPYIAPDLCPLFLPTLFIAKFAASDSLDLPFRGSA